MLVSKVVALHNILDEKLIQIQPTPFDFFLQIPSSMVQKTAATHIYLEYLDIDKKRGFVGKFSSSVY